METNVDKKQAHWESLLPKFKHLEPYCKIDVKGLTDESIYYHPVFILDDNVSITSQGDLNNNHIYAFRFNLDTSERFSVDIVEELLDNVIIGYHTNKEAVMIALETLIKFKTHVNTLNYYVTDYISNVLIGKSIKNITKNFISELYATEKLVEFMQKNIPQNQY